MTQGETCHVVSYRRCDTHHVKELHEWQQATGIHFLKDLRAHLKFSESSENCTSCSSQYSCCFHGRYWINGMPRSERKVTISEGKLWLSCQTRFGFTRASRSHGPWQLTRDTPLPSSPAARYDRPLRSSALDFLRLRHASTAPPASRADFCSRVKNSQSFFRWQGTSS